MSEQGADPPDLGFEVYRLMESVGFRITADEVVLRLRESRPTVAEEKVRATVRTAIALRLIAMDGSFYDEPTAKACEARAWSRFRKEAPGLSDRLYNHVLYDIMYSWMK
jgi:hypothetical protein